MKGAKYRIRPYWMSTIREWWFASEVSVSFMGVHLYWKTLNYWPREQRCMDEIIRHAEGRSKRDHRPESMPTYFNEAGEPIQKNP